MRNIIIYLCVINAIAFLLYGLDKQKSKTPQMENPGGNASWRGFFGWLHRGVFGNAGIPS